ncbi:MAG: PAS domain S-box protein [Anaerolineales bacterium]|jgi:PAS domain S-box-containing protein|nr:PAS domain S-box protein [Anaerolineales bacterium]
MPNVYQKALVEISRQVLYSTHLDQLVEEAIAPWMSLLRADYCGVWELAPNQSHFLLKAGLGWQPGYVGQTQLEASSASQAGLTLLERQTLIINDMEAEQRVKIPALLREHGVLNAMTAIIPGRQHPYGVLGVYARNRDSFAPVEANFLQNIANLFAVVIDRQQVEDDLRASTNQLAVILGGIAEGITVQRRDGSLLFANPIAAQLVGLPDEQTMIALAPEKIMENIEIFDEEGQIFPIQNLPGRRALRGEEKASELVRFQFKNTGQEGWWIIRSAPIFNANKQVQFAVNIFHPITDIKQAEEDQRFLAEASDMLARSMDYEAVLANIAQMAVKNLADWCAVHLIDQDQQVQQLEVAHKDPAKVALTRALQEKYPPDPKEAGGIYRVLRSGEAAYYADINDASLQKLARNPEHLEALRSLGLRSGLILPLIARGQTLGALTLAWAESGRRYGEREVNLGLELTRRASLAVDNVRLYQEASALNAELEAKVARRTAQLEQSIRQLTAEISEKQQAQSELQKTKAMFSDLFELSPDALFLTNEHGIIERINTQAEILFGYKKVRLLGKPIDKLLPQLFQEGHALHRASYQRQPERRAMGANLDLYALHKSGRQFPVDVLLSPIKIEDQWLVISAVRDITAQKNIQAELAEVQHRLIDNQEADRLLLAQELHDGVVQELFSVNFQLAEIESVLAEREEQDLHKKVSEASQMNQKVIQSLRIISRDLRPPALAPFGLEQAIYSHVEHFQEIHPELQIETDLTQDGQLLDERLRLVLFRIYQHAISNVARHAQAKRLWVRFDVNEHQIVLEIKDDGVGFAMPGHWLELARQGHFGLVGTRERVQAIGGQLTILSQPGEGTQLRVVVQR